MVEESILYIEMLAKAKFFGGITFGKCDEQSGPMGLKNIVSR